MSRKESAYRLPRAVGTKEAVDAVVSDRQVELLQRMHVIAGARAASPCTEDLVQPRHEHGRLPRIVRRVNVAAAQRAELGEAAAMGERLLLASAGGAPEGGHAREVERLRLARVGRQDIVQVPV